MFDEFSLEVFIIKIKVKGYLENKANDEKLLIDTFGIRNKKNLSYKQEDVIYKIKIFDNKIILIRENSDFINTFIFEKNKNTKSEYYLKKYATNIDIELRTQELFIDDEKIEIRYIIKDTSEEYHYIIEMSEKL